MPKSLTQQTLPSLIGSFNRKDAAGLTEHIPL